MKNIQKYYPLITVGLMILVFTASGCRKDLSAPEDFKVTCYAATYGKGIFRSENGGTSWFPMELNQDEIYHYFKRIYLSPEKDSIYIATTGAGLWILNPQTELFEDVNEFKDRNVRSIAFSSVLNNKKIFDILTGIDDKGVFKAEYKSGNWNALNNGLDFLDVNVLFTQGQVVFAGTVKDLFKWNNPIGTWKVSSEGIKNKNIISMAADLKGDIFYAGSGPYEEEKGFFEDIPCLYKSTDKGKTWIVSDKGIPDGTLVYIIAVNPRISGRVYLGTSNGIYLSNNNGIEWIKIDKGLPKELEVFDIEIANMNDGKDVIFASGSMGVYMTTDDGTAEWINKSYGLPRTMITSIAVLTE